MDKKKILVVDDEEDFCAFIKNYLVKRGYPVDVAYDAMKAKDLIVRKKYDFIFLDCDMPEMSGVELMEVIKKVNPQAKKIMVSGYELINEDFSKNMGVDAFLTKPISLESIKEIVENG